MQNDLRFDDLRLLLALQRQGSFLSAGRALGLSTSTVARRIDALELAMGRPLVVRSSSGTAIEPDALGLVALAEQLELGLEALRRDEPAATSASPLAGTVRLSASEVMMVPLTQIMAQVRRQHPEIEIELISETRLSDLVRRETDFGLRSARASSKSLIERKLASIRLGLFAAQSYVDRRLPRATLPLADIGRHDFVGYEGEMRKFAPHRVLTSLGAARFVFRSNSDLAVLEAARQGQGIALLGEPLGREAGLVAIRCEAELPVLPLYLVYHPSLRRVPRMQVVARALEGAVRARLGS
jgi:DNA-binding transcriptional LysR family regulator